MKRYRGLSLIEVMVAFLIFFLVALYSISIFAQGQRSWLRAQQQSTATGLANSRLQQLTAYPYPDLVAQVGNQTYAFDPPFSDYVYGLSLARPPGDAYQAHLLEIVVNSTTGASARAATVVLDDQQFYGVAAIAPAPGWKAAFVPGPGASASPGGPVGFLTSNGAGPPTLVWTPDAVPYRPFFGLAYENNRLWGGGFSLTPLVYPSIVSPGAGPWVDPALSPSPAGSPPNRTVPRFTGLASDGLSGGRQVFMGDATNRALWVIDDKIVSNPVFRPGPLRPTVRPMGAPAGVAYDPANRVVWVADRENQCLRKLCLTSLGIPVGYPPLGFGITDLSWLLEQAGTIGQWDTRAFRPPPIIGMGAPQGVACTAQGLVYVIDGGRIYRYQDATSPSAPTPHPALWTLWEPRLPFASTAPSGMALIPGTHILLINCAGGALWKYENPTQTPGTGSFTQMWP